MMALKAVMDGFEVMPMIEAAKMGDIFVTATGNKSVVRKKDMKLMKDGAVLANTGHFNVEIDISALESLAMGKASIRENTEEYTLKDGRKIYLLAEGRLVNLAAAEGHPSEVMDMSFANQFNALLRLHQKGKGGYALGVHVLPPELDQEIGELKLHTMGISIDKLTEDQIRYASDYSAGT
jgi:adenosylhomocysteinase